MVDTSYLSLLAASNLLGHECLNVNTAFIQCKDKSSDPLQGEKVTKCTLGLMDKAEKNCSKSYEAYKKCLRSNNKEFRYCRKAEKEFEECMKG
eukprot:maker-scaffold_27-snap-gene-4.54-mRNA-1 protein AED:0.02 eAED:0.02 QI:78/0.75/0.8/1/0/0/5/19/92